MADLTQAERALLRDYVEAGRAVLLRNTEEDRARLAREAHRYQHSYMTRPQICRACWKLADAILTALRSPK